MKTAVKDPSLKVKSESLEALRLPVERIFEHELTALLAEDKEKGRPENWRLSPKSVLKFIVGGFCEDKQVEISRKFYGDGADVQISRIIASLASDRPVLLLGEPGTAKSYLSEHIAAAISGMSTNTIQGTAGTTEDNVKYSWNYAMLLSKGPCLESLVPSPLYVGMSKGIITRFEEMTRCLPEIQDVLISLLSEKLMTIPELLSPDNVLYAMKGFNMIATANSRDRGVNEMSAALKRRFSFELINPIKDIQQEMEIVGKEVQRFLDTHRIKTELPMDVVELLTTTFNELRTGETSEGVKIDRPSVTMSTAELVETAINSTVFRHYFEETLERSAVLALKGSLKDNADDLKKIKTYFDIIVKKRSEKMWKMFFEAGKLL